MVKKTMAILGDTGRFPAVLMEILMKQDLRLLYVSENEEKNVALKKQLGTLKVVAEMEFLSCERDGCWEADIIALTRPENISANLVEKIKEVATQKIVLVISENIKQCDKPELEKLLPYSKVIEIKLDIPAKQFSVYGKNAEAIEDVKRIFENTVYQIKK